jgi:hypothetical protein
MNADHVEAMILLAKSHAGIEATEATMTSVDRVGFSLRLKTDDGVKGLASTSSARSLRHKILALCWSRWFGMPGREARVPRISQYRIKYSSSIDLPMESLADSCVEEAIPYFCWSHIRSGMGSVWDSSCQVIRLQRHRWS